jgi:hypothetical protein
MNPTTSRRLRRLTVLLIAWCATTGGVFSGCRGLFTPAIPEPPSGRPILANYRTPELTLQTMEQGIAAKAAGGAAWLGAFADSTRPEEGPAYHQVFDPADKAACQCTAPNDWRVPEEQNFFPSLLDVRPGDDYLAVFDSVEATPDYYPPGDTQAFLHRHYVIYANAPDGLSTLKIAVGYADLTFTRFLGPDRWLITRWEDHVDPEVTDPDVLTLGRRRLESTR